jgi:hypothetical protein
MTELRLTGPATVSSSPAGPLILQFVRLLAGDTANLADGHGHPILELHAGPAPWWRGEKRLSGVEVRLSGRGAVLLVEVEPAPDPARARTPDLVIIDGEPKQRTYRAAPELNDDATATMRRPRT